MANDNIKKLRAYINRVRNESVDGVDLNKLFLPNKEIVKLIIRQRNGKISKDDIDLMVNGFPANGLLKGDLSTLVDIKNKMDTPFKRRFVENTINDFKKNFSKYNIPIDENDEMYKDAENMKRMFKQKLREFVRKGKELIEDSTFATISLSQSVPGSIQLVVTPTFPMPSFNISGMMTMIISVLLSMKSIISKYLDFREIIPYFDVIYMLLGKKDANKIAGIINSIYNTVNAILDGIINRVRDFINVILSLFKSLLDPREEAKRAKKVQKQLKKLKYLPNNNMSKVDEDDVDSVNAILDEWEVVDNSTEDRLLRRKKEARDTIEQARNELNKLENINNELEELTNIKEDITIEDEETIVYDIELPDGKIIKGLTRDEIKNYEINYNILYK